MDKYIIPFETVKMDRMPPPPIKPNSVRIYTYPTGKVRWELQAFDVAFNGAEIDLAIRGPKQAVKDYAQSLVDAGLIPELPKALTNLPSW